MNRCANPLCLKPVSDDEEYCSLKCCSTTNALRTTANILGGLTPNTAWGILQKFNPKLENLSQVRIYLPAKDNDEGLQ